MTYLDPDPLYIADDCGCTFCRLGIRDGLGHDDGPTSLDFDRPTPSLTVPLVLLCAVLTVLVAVWWIRG